MHATTKDRTTPVLAGLVAAATLAAGAAHAAITYSVDQIIGVGSVVGSITTDGATGTLAASDILSWNLNLHGVGASFNLNNANSGAFIGGADTTATTTHIYYNFNATDFGYLLFQVSFGNSAKYWCNNAEADVLCLQGATVTPVFFGDPSTQNAPMTGTQIIATAANVVPEPAAWVVMLLGFAGIGLAMRGRRVRAA